MDKKIIASKHAIDRWRKRNYDSILTDKQIAEWLSIIVDRGVVVERQPDGSVIYQYKDHQVVASAASDTITVITYLGDSTWMHWEQRQKQATSRRRHRIKKSSW